jgi:hypothetical protein
MNATVFIGLALTSHVSWAYAGADFTDVSVLSTSVATGDTWTSADVGAVNIAGLTYWTGTAWSVTGSGTDIWDSSDQFRFVYRRMTGDGAIVTRIDNFDSVDTWSKAGAMIRESLAANSKRIHALVRCRYVGVPTALVHRRRNRSYGRTVARSAGVGQTSTPRVYAHRFILQRWL